MSKVDQCDGGGAGGRGGGIAKWFISRAFTAFKCLAVFQHVRFVGVAWYNATKASKSAIRPVSCTCFECDKDTHAYPSRMHYITPLCSFLHHQHAHPSPPHTIQTAPTKESRYQQGGGEKRKVFSETIGESGFLHWRKLFLHF